LLDLKWDTHGYIARDDKKKELVVAFRGRLAPPFSLDMHTKKPTSMSPTNFIADFLAKLVPIALPGVQAPGAS
jgi:hypothetical protein